MQTIERNELIEVWGGGEIDLPGTPDNWGRSDDAQTTGKCGLGPYSFGYTPECKAHDDCVERWDRRVGRPLADVVCLPKLGPAAVSAARCAADPQCPK